MDTATILTLVKARIGISTTVRDTYLIAIIESVIKELADEKGISLKTEDMNQVMFIVDYSTWRYESKGESKGMPRHLQFRLHNLFISQAKGDADGTL